VKQNMNDSESQDYQAVIRAIVARVLQEQANPASEQSALATPVVPPVGRVLVAVCCDECLNPEATAALNELKAANFALNQPEESAFKKRAEREQLIEQSDVVLLPAVGDDDAAKMALGIFDEPVSRVALSAIAMGKPLVAAMHAPYDAALQKNSPVLRRVFEGYRRALQNYGFEIVQYSGLATAVQAHLGLANGNDLAANGAGMRGSNRGRKQLITAQDVDAAARNGKKLQLPAGAIVTPLARDRARELGLDIE
jgi:hypothetical protein